MPIPDLQRPVLDRAFVQTYMYHGRASRRPSLRLGLGLVVATAMVVGSVLIYRDLAAWEADGQPSRTMHALSLLLYEIGGKGLVSGVLAVTGLAIGVGSVYGFTKDRAVARRGRDA